jgi:SAM-dependent methyltransferase
VIRNREFQAYQAFLGTSRDVWGGALFRALRARADRTGAATPEALEAALARDAVYGAFDWFERNLQERKLNGPYGIYPAIQADAEQWVAWLDRPLPEGLLSLSLDPMLPDYFTRHDIHRMPGGLWAHPLSGLVYRQSAGQAGGVVSKPGLHERFTASALRGCERLVVDLGCGFGKSAVPFALASGALSVVGIDLSAPCLRVAAQDAVDRGLSNVRYVQADAARPLPAILGADVSTSTMVLHELPPEAIRGLLRTAFDVLRPGGTTIHLDFLPPDDAFARFIHYGHGRRNNEPFMEPLAKLDLRRICTDIGFVDIAIEDFDETDPPPTDRGATWRLPWAVLRARRPG